MKFAHRISSSRAVFARIYPFTALKLYVIKKGIKNRAPMEKMQEAREEENPKGGIYANSPSAVEQYFSYYGKLANQQNMLADWVRTGHYYDAITRNPYYSLVHDRIEPILPERW